MKRKVINENGRDKAFIGAAIGAIGNLVGGIIGKRKEKKAQEKAYRQAQEEQTRSEGVQQAAAMSAQYANQDYVDQYRNKITLKNGGKINMKKKDNDRIALAKKFKCGGRKRANLGSEIVNDFKNIGQEFKGDNLGNTIVSAINGIAGTINPTGNSVGAAGAISGTDAATMNNIQRNREVAQQADQRKQQRTTAARCGTKKKLACGGTNKKFACGGRKKGLFGIGSAIGGVSNMIGQAMKSTDPQKQVKKSDGFSYDAPKTGIEQNSYQTDKNGNPINAVNTNNAAYETNTSANVGNGNYMDRLSQARMGMRKCAKCGGKKC